MIHYHGTPIGGNLNDKAHFLIGRHALVPFPRRDDMAVVADACQSFVFDNGAFTIWRKGGQLDTEGYYSWVDEWHRHPGFDWALIPDVIDGDEDANDRLLEDWPGHMPGVPVWHLHESLERLQRLAQDWRIVALGSSGQWSSPGTAEWWKRMGKALSAVCDDKGRPLCKLHGLRMLDPSVFTQMPLSSADSTNAAVNGGSLSRFGMYPPPTAGQRSEIIARRVEQYTSSPVWLPEEQLDMWDGH